MTCNIGKQWSAPGKIFVPKDGKRILSGFYTTDFPPNVAKASDCLPVKIREGGKCLYGRKFSAG